MSTRMTATSVIRLVVEVTPTDSWGGECTVEQVKKQGTEAALAAIQRVFEKTGVRAKVVDVAAVRMVINEEKP